MVPMVTDNNGRYLENWSSTGQDTDLTALNLKVKFSMNVLG